MPFLDLYDGQPPLDVPQLQSIQIPLARETIDRCRNLGWDSSAFYRAVWAILLHRHTGSDHVTFAVFGGDTKKIYHDSDLRRCDVSVAPETSVADLLATEQRLDTFKPVSSGRRDYNTAVIIQEDAIEEGCLLDSVVPLPQDFEIVLLVQNTEVPKLWLVHKIPSCFHAQNLASVLEQAVSELSRNPHMVKDLNLFSDCNRHQVANWNEREQQSSHFIPITDIIRGHAIQRPDHEAICAWDGILTYSELDEVTTKLAYYLRHTGVQEGSMVLLAFEKTMWAVVALLSVLKAGGTFVPVSPSYPPSRLKAIIDAAGSSILLTSKDLTAGLQSLGVEVIVFNDSLLNHLPTERYMYTLAKADPQRPAYVLFTSGSTGTPKGCVLHHQALSTLADQGSPLHLHPSSRVLQFVPAIFAASSIDTYLPLLVGATVCIGSQRDLINDIATVMQRYRVTWACMTPSTISSVEPAQLAGLKTLVLAGEPVGEHTRNTWAKSVRLLSGYGLSEIVGAGAISTLAPGRHPRNIGLSPASRIWVADPANIHRLAPVGAVGEMLIDGPNIGQGYLGDPEKTARAFVQPPQWIHDFYPEGAPCRILRTGDLVRYQPDGSLVYIGRKDTQVKIRGKRVELGEIEAQIRLQQSTTGVVIVEAAAPLNADAVVLVAFIHLAQSEEDGSLTTSALVGKAGPEFQREAAILDSKIRTSLPDHMIPSFYLPLSRIPKTATGKTDRRALRSEIQSLTLQQIDGLTSDTRPTAQPRNDAERVLHDLFARVIGREPESFGIDQKFVRLGGDSIKAMTLVRLCRQEGLSLEVSDILDEGTVSHLATIARQCASLHENEVTIQPEEVPRDDAMAQLEGMGISKDAIEDINLCSSIQEGILMSQLKNPDKYALRLLFEIKPPRGEQSVSISRLQQAWARLVQHHRMLRTMFVTHVSPSVHTVQVQLKQGSLPSIRSILDDITPEHVLALDQTSQLYNTLPLLTLYSTPTGRVLARMELTHAVVDGMSMAIVVRDFCKMYNGPTDSPSAFLYPQYIDYLKHTHTKSAISYWKDYLAGFDSCRLPTSAEASHDEDNILQFKSISVEAGPTADFNRFSSETGITTASIVKLAWALTLRAFCNTNDVCFGYLASSRDAPLPGIVDGVGPLINIMMCRVNMSQDANVVNMLRSVQADFVRGLPHKAAALGDIRRAVGVASDEVLFNTCISQFPVTNSDSDDSISMVEILRHDPTEFDVNLEVMVLEDELRPTLKANTTIVPTEQLEQLAAVFSHAMQIVITHPSREINQLDLLPPGHRSTIGRWNQNIPQPIGSCVHDLIRKQCEDQPTATAVCAWDGNWTYAELDQISSCLAQHLRNGGVKTESFVPVLMEKGRWVPVAMLAILKAGGAFVLLEPLHPLKRLEDICGDIKPGIILTSTECQPTASILCPEVIVLGNAEQLAMQAEQAPDIMPVEVSPRNAAYAVFTSGSTGKPKGVVIEHLSLATSAFAMMRHSPIDRNTRLLEYASFAFDVSILDLMITLVAGACLCIPSADARENRLLETINEYKANYIALTPTVARTLQPERLTTLKTLKVSGEALLTSDIKQWSVAPHIRLINMYGPAECTINATACTSVTPGPFSSSIGHAMCSSTSWIVDPNNHHKLLPIGAVGELVIQGPIVGRGYINRPEQTEAAFIAPPAWLSQFRAVTADERLYKTGDLVKYAPDGSLLYKGRKDFQVKLRGQRFELVEVEEHLRRAFPWTSEVIAEIGSRYGNQSKTLVAFLYGGDTIGHHQAAHDMQEGNDAELLCPTSEAFDQEVSRAKSALSASLPSFMQPTLYVPLLRVPRSRSGKTDRGRLRRLISTVLSGQTGPSNTGNTVVQAPRSKSESVLLQTVAETIGITAEEIGLQDNFFRLGGDSVTAMSLVGLLRQRGYDITVAEIFKEPGLERLAENMRAISGSGEVFLSIAPFSLLGDDPNSQDKVIQEGITQCKVSRDDIEDIYPCSAVQGGLFLYSFLGRPDSLVVTWVYKLRTTTNLDVLQRAWTETTQAHPILRTRIIVIDGENPQQVVLRQSPEMEFIDSTDTHPELPIKFASGSPLLRAAVIRRSQSIPQDRLIISLHHSVYDGWSLGLLIKELERAYSGLQLHPRPFNPFIRYVEQTYSPALDFWRDKMANLRASIFPALPSHVDKADPHTVMIRRVSIPSVHGLQFTLSTKIRWAWARLISLHTKNPDVVMMLVTTGRTAPVPDIDKVVAPTLAIFPHRVHVDRSQKLSNALHRDQVQQMETIPHEHLGSRGIARVATGPTSIAGMQFLLVVQPEEEQNKSPLYDEKEMMPQKKAFHVRAVNLHCYIKKDSLEIHACYDNRILSSEEMDGILCAFDSIFQQIFHEPEILVEQIGVER